MKIGLFFGSFNPVHVGHMILANYMLEYTDLERIWFIVSPQNPFKKKSDLLDEKYRYDMVNIAIGENDKMKASDIEFTLEQPSYTIDTLNLLKKENPEDEFVIIMGTDNLENFNKWKDFVKILNRYKIYVYSRHTSDGGYLKGHPHIKIVDAHMVEMSSTFVRQAIKENRDIRYLLPTGVWDYIKKMNFYK
jgi:nicotinate-nucleotide adenylyltransferase